MLLPGRSGSSLVDFASEGLSTLKSSGPKGTPDSRRCPKSSSGGGGRGETDFRVGMLRAGILEERSSIGRGECLGLGLGLWPRALGLGL